MVLPVQLSGDSNLHLHMDIAQTQLQLLCPECGSRLTANAILGCNNGHEFRDHGGKWDLLPKSISKLTVEEGKYHEDQRTTWAEQNQIHAERNVVFHRSVVSLMAQLCSSRSHILELGGGIGFDLKLFLTMRHDFKVYVFSEVSMELVDFVQRETKSDRVLYCTIDAQRIPFENGQFDAVLMVAAFHHLPDMDAALSEIARVTKPGGLIAFGIEPNRWWLALVRRMRGLLRMVLPKKDHSAADEEAPGLRRSDFERLAGKHGLRIQHFEPVWFLCGFIHYGLEFLYRIFRLKRRVQLPAAIQRLLIYLDIAILTIPGIREFSWHNSVVYQKR